MSLCEGCKTKRGFCLKKCINRKKNQYFSFLVIVENRCKKVAGIEVCRGCGRPIQERFLLRVSDSLYYHERCLACSVCGEPLDRICYARHSNLYCRHDYNRLYAKKCVGCGDAPSATELVMRAGDAVFHVRCFVCVVCGARLQRGDHCVLKQGQLFCRHDYEKEVEMLQGYVQGDYPCDDLMSPRCGDGRRGPKRPRTILTTQQRRAFKASFELSPKPCRKIREGLAKDTGLSVRIVQVWFQNQRAKMKKIQKKARDNKNNSSNKDDCDNMNCSDGDSKANIKIKQEDHSPHGLSAFLNDSCSDTDHDRNFFSIKEEIHMDDNNYFKDSTSQNTMTDFPDTPDKIESGLAHFPYGGPAHLQLLAQTSSPLNPIDRLYSMQNSYFCAEDTNTM